MSAYMWSDVRHLHPVDIIVPTYHVIESVLPVHCHQRHIIFIVEKESTISINHLLDFGWYSILNDSTVNKEDILAKSRKEKNDEGLIAAENQGRKIGIAAFCFVFIFILLFNFITGQASSSAVALFWAFFAAEAYPKYKFTSESHYLLIVIGGTIASIAALANYVLTVLG